MTRTYNKNGLAVGTIEVIDSSGRLTGSAITDSIDDRVVIS